MEPRHEPGERAGDPLSHRRRSSSPSLLHAGVLGGAFVTRAEDRPQPPAADAENFVDAQLVRFGKPRDLTFLPHKQGVVKDKGRPSIKVAKDMNALPRLEDKKPTRQDVDPLKKTHAELFKNLKDRSPEGVQAVERGLAHRLARRHRDRGQGRSLHPGAHRSDRHAPGRCRRPSRTRELANLTADVCLTIAGVGVLTNYQFIRKSGNCAVRQLARRDAVTIKKLPPPPDRDIARRPRAGRLCPATFSKQ